MTISIGESQSGNSKGEVHPQRIGHEDFYVYRYAVAIIVSAALVGGIKVSNHRNTIWLADLTRMGLDPGILFDPLALADPRQRLIRPQGDR